MAPPLVTEAEAVEHRKAEPERSRHVPDAGTGSQRTRARFPSKAAAVQMRDYTLHQSVFRQNQEEGVSGKGASEHRALLSPGMSLRSRRPGWPWASATLAAATSRKQPVETD